ncbi:MAG: agmatine deiminase [Verrucomicrobia bacterium]|nr:MAG: agmatine deiminase [Verrucomicrobiota bacterium]
MPAEWEPHEATWLGWPHNPTDWPDKLDTIRWVYGEIVRKIAPGEIVRMLVNSKAEEKVACGYLTRAGADVKRVEFIVHPTNRGWTRDSGPIFVKRQMPSPLTPLPSDGRGRQQRTRAGNSMSVSHAHRLATILPLPGGEGRGEGERREGETAIVHFHFNAWAKYDDWQKDRRVPETAARVLRKRLFNAEFNGQNFVLEGGGIDVNGRGTLLTTEECYLDPKIVGDDTHGHIDDICRFVNPKTVVLIQETNRKDINYRPLAENWERIQDLRLEDGSKPEIVPLPMPAPLYFDGYRLPASYANFYISNAAVLVPTFNDPNDRIALGILTELFTDRPVVGIHAIDLVLGFGTLHCLTQQQPA